MLTPTSRIVGPVGVGNLSRACPRDTSPAGAARCPRERPRTLSAVEYADLVQLSTSEDAALNCAETTADVLEPLLGLRWSRCRLLRLGIPLHRCIRQRFPRRLHVQRELRRWQGERLRPERLAVPLGRHETRLDLGGPAVSRVLACRRIQFPRSQELTPARSDSAGRSPASPSARDRERPRSRNEPPRDALASRST